MKKLYRVPNGIRQVNGYYGNPDLDGNFELDLNWAQENLKRYRFPFPMKLSWRPDELVTFFKAHYKVGDIMVDALREILAYRDLDYLRDNGFDHYGGVFNFRYKRGGTELSMHSYAIAIDINPHLAPMGGNPFGQPDFIIEAFEKRGFIWGGRWKRPDGQHFQAAKNC